MLERTGVSREQADAHVQLMREMMENNFATKQDLKDLAIEISSSIERFAISIKNEMTLLKESATHDMNLLKESTRYDMGLLQASTKHDMNELRDKLTIRLGGIVVAVAGILGVVIEFWR